MPSKRIRKHLASASGLPKCGRQLSRPGLTVANQGSMQTTQDLSEVTCRHCLRVVGLIPKLTGRQGGGFDSEIDFSEEESDVEI